MWRDWGIASHLLWLFMGRVKNRELCLFGCPSSVLCQGFTCSSWEQLERWCQGRIAGPSLEFSTVLECCRKHPAFLSSWCLPHGTSVQFFNGMGHILTSEHRLDLELTQARRLKVQVHHYLKPAHIYRAGTRTVPPLFPPIAEPQG